MEYEFQTTIFQPVGGMDMIAKAFGARSAGAIRFNAKVTQIEQDERGVTATYVDTAQGGAVRTANGRLVRLHDPACRSSARSTPGRRGDARGDRRGALRASVKIGLQFKRRFWEEDEQIYGGISYTDLPIAQIPYPSAGYGSAGKGVLLGAYTFGAERVRVHRDDAPTSGSRPALEMGAQIHPQYKAEFDTASRSAGTASRTRWAASAAGPTSARATTIATCARSTVASCLPASTRRTSALAGGGAAVVARRDHTAPPARAGGLNHEDRRRPVRPRLYRRRGGAVAAGTGVAGAVGRQVYRQVCQACHMANARGAVGAGRIASLAGNPNLKYPEYPIGVVTGGKGAMPWFRGG